MCTHCKKLNWLQIVWNCMHNMSYLGVVGPRRYRCYSNRSPVPPPGWAGSSSFDCNSLACGDNTTKGRAFFPCASTRVAGWGYRMARRLTDSNSSIDAQFAYLSTSNQTIRFCSAAYNTWCLDILCHDGLFAVLTKHARIEIPVWQFLVLVPFIKFCWSTRCCKPNDLT